MDAKTRAMLSDAEQQLLRDTTKAKLAKLDEDALIELHSRVRRARTKYVKQHRRLGAGQVRKDRSRTRAAGSASRAAVKAEAFEEALGLVSARLAKVASDAAEALRKERLAAAARVKGKGSTSRSSVRPKDKSGKAKEGPARARSRRPVEEKRNASARGAKRQAQARRDAKR
jgi:hypothetical protein